MADTLQRQEQVQTTTNIPEYARPYFENLMNRGLANNPDMRIATLRLAQAKVRSTQASAGRLPTLSLPTFPSWDAKRPIDHILVGGMDSGNYRTYPAAGSDHLAIGLDLMPPALSPADSPSTRPPA